MKFASVVDGHYLMIKNDHKICICWPRSVTGFALKTHTCCKPVGTATLTTCDNPAYGGYTGKMLEDPGAPVTAAPVA